MSRARAIAQRRALSEMTTKIVVERMTAAPVLNPVSLVLEPVAALEVYSGVAFLHSLGGGGDVFVGEQPIPTRSTIISIPPDATSPRPDDMVTITSCAEDAALVGLAFRIITVTGAGVYRSTRQLTCVTWSDSQMWERA